MSWHTGSRGRDFRIAMFCHNAIIGHNAELLNRLSPDGASRWAAEARPDLEDVGLADSDLGI